MSTEFKYIVRMLGKDLDGTKKVIQSLADLKGVGQNLAHYITASIRLDPKLRLGTLTDEQIGEIERRLKDSSRLGLPPYLMNRRKDLESGSNVHLVGSDLELALRNDLDREKTILSWRGVRHSLGLKLRGQRTRTTGRKGRTIGVKKAALVRPREEGEKAGRS